MNKNTKINYVIFFVLSFIIILGYSILFPPSPKKESSTKDKDSQIIAKDSIPVVTSDNPTAKVSTTVKNQIIKQSEDLIEISSDVYRGKIDTYGGRIVEWILQNYNESTNENSDNYSLLKNLPPNFNVSISSQSINIPNPIPFKYYGNKHIEVKDGPRDIKLNWKSPEGLEIEKTLTFSPNSYLINSYLTITNNTQNLFAEQITVDIFSVLLKKTTASRNNEFITLASNDIEKSAQIPEEPKAFPGNISWFGFLDKYFLYTFLPETQVDSAVKLYTLDENGLVGAVYTYPRNEIKPSNSNVYKSKIYLGPLDYNILQSSGSDLQYAIDYGVIEFLAKPVLWMLNYLNTIFKNYGISIIVITILIRIIFLPLTLKSMASMKKVQSKMQELKPKIDALKEKYKDDKATQNTELMKLYTSHGVNPLSSLGGCLPLLIQIPVFFALYEVLLYSIDLRHSKFLWVNDLSAPETLFDIPGIGIPFRILPLAMGISWFISQKMTPTTAPGSEQMELQMKMMQFMPIIFTVMFWSLPSGLILYWTVSNILSIAQQLYVNKSTNAH
jgi:YidC/Oxa1 family membrane protein insertase